MVHGSWFMVNQAEHLSRVLLALFEMDGVLSCGDAGMGVLEGIANVNTVDGEVAFGIFATDGGSCNYNIHTFNI